MMFTLEKFGNRKVSFEKDDLSLNIDIWGDGEWIFTPEFALEMYALHEVYMVKPMGEPTRSRSNTHAGVNSAKFPTTISMSFVCQEDLDDFEEQVRKALKKEGAFTSYKKIREEEQKKAEEAKKVRDEERAKALKANAIKDATNILKEND